MKDHRAIDDTAPGRIDRREAQRVIKPGRHEWAID